MWKKVYKSTEIPVGQSRCYKAGGAPIGIFRTGDGLYAVDNRCPHYDAELHMGEVVDGVVFCPWHRWAFQLKDGFCRLNRRFDLEVYPIKEENGHIWVDAEAGAVLSR